MKMNMKVLSNQRPLDGSVPRSLTLSGPETVAGRVGAAVCCMPVALLMKVALMTVTLIAAVGTRGSAWADEKQTPSGEKTAIALPMPFGVEWIGPQLWVTSITDEAVYVFDLSEPGAPSSPTKLAGNGRAGDDGDGSIATQASMNWPHEVRVDSRRNLYIADTRNHQIRRVDAATNVITTTAGGDEAGFDQPHSVVLLDEETLLVADTKNHRICTVDLTSNRVDTFCGDGTAKLPVEGQARSAATLFGPRSLAVDASNIWIALREGNSIWRIDRATDRLHRVAGTGEKGYSGDGSDPLNAQFSGPKGLAVDGLGRILVVDTENHCVRRIDMGRKLIETVLGGTKAAVTQSMKRPHGIAASPNNGDFWVADSENDRLLFWSDNE